MFGKSWTETIQYTNLENQVLVDFEPANLQTSKLRNHASIGSQTAVFGFEDFLTRPRDHAV